MADQSNTKTTGRGMIVIYDGECPFCSSYVRLMALRRNTGSVELIDARSDDSRVADLWRRGYDLNEGMAAIFGGTVYYGSDALSLISSLSSDGGPAQRLLTLLLRSPARARVLYPTMKAGRSVVLRLLGRSGIKPVLD